MKYTKYKEYPKVEVTAQLPTELRNRAFDIRSDEELAPDIEITLSTIDTAIVEYMGTILPKVVQDTLTVDVPVLYASPERWKTIQADGVLRDKFEKVQLPLVVVQRTNMTPASINSAVNKYNVYTVQQKYNRRNAYDKYNIQNRVTPSEKYYSMMIPDYYNILYDGLIWTEYSSDMNKLIEAISFESNTYWGKTGSHRFRVEIESFDSDVDLPESEDRLVRTKFSMKVFGYILPKYAMDKNGMKMPVTQINYSPKKIVTFVELVGTGETYANIEDTP